MAYNDNEVKEKMNIIKEHFKSIHEMIDTIESRETNKVMTKDDKASHTGSYDFTKTHSYEESKELYRNGYVEILDKIKAGMLKNMKNNSVVNRRQVTTNVIGYAPHVPNAILGLPNSMIMTKSQPQKARTLSICYCICQNAFTEADEFIKSGIAVLSVINSLELQGVRVKLRINFYSAREGKDVAFGTIDVKDYREHLDIQKLCFPIAHPSMFRRMGFGWLETCKGLKDEDWSYGYGKTMFDEDLINEYLLEKDEVYLNLNVTKRYNYDVDRIIESFNLK